MFPKLELVPIKTYFMVLAKIRRPSTTPSASTPRSFSSRITSAAALATSVAESTEMAASAEGRGGGRAAAGGPADPYGAGFLGRGDRGEGDGASGRHGERVVVETVHVRAD